MARQIFRKAALEKLSTPEKLDQLIKIISLKSWLVLFTIALALFTALGWSFTGRIKTKLQATGVLLGGEVYNIVSNTNGQLINLKVGIGDTIKQGDVIAEVEQPELLQRISASKATLEEKNFELKQLLSFGTEGSRLQDAFIDQKQISLEQQIRANEKNLSFQKQQLEVEKGLQEKGLITRTQVVRTEQQIEEIQSSIESLKAQIVQTSSQQLDVDFDLKQKVTLTRQRIAQEERTLSQLENQYALNTNVRSLYSGEVVEVLSNPGIVVNKGTSLVKLKSYQTSDDGVKGILYVSSQDGKKIKVGMEALVVPATVQPQEFGFMKAKVTYVSEFPVTQEGMMVSMNNDQIVESLLEMGAPFEVFVDFEKDPVAYSGYKWTSAQGPELTINSGTTCAGKITVKEEAPIALVVPALKNLFDLY
ncbi:MAG: NHLP bacteriocin system secretion protein [Bacteroidota bacterium]